MFGWNGKTAPARLKSLLAEIDKAQQDRSRAQNVLQQADASEAEALEALERERIAALQASVELLAREILGPVQLERDRVLYEVDQHIMQLGEILDRLERAETALFGAVNVLKEKRTELGASCKEAPLPAVPRAYHSVGKFGGVLKMNGGRMEFVRERWRLLIAARQLEYTQA